MTEVMIEVSSLEAALKGDAPYAISSSTVRMFPAAAATWRGVSAANDSVARPFTRAPRSSRYLTHLV